MLLVASNDAGVSFPASLCVVSKLYVSNVQGQDATQIIDLSDDLTITHEPLMFYDRLSAIAENSYPAQSLHSCLSIFCRRAMF
jgi:hypothetical protein